MKKIFAIDVEKCTGCGACELMCSLVKERVCWPSHSRIKVFKMEKEAIYVPMVCMHCEEAPCMDVCPAIAIKRDEKTGAVLIDERLCIGCRACMVVCPFGAISMNSKKKVAIKCDLCEGNPACVKICVTKALRFEKIEVADMPKRRSMMELMVESIRKSRELIE